MFLFSFNCHKLLCNHMPDPMIRNPYRSVTELHNTLTLQEQDELIELRQDRGLRLQVFDLPLD